MTVSSSVTRSQVAAAAVRYAASVGVEVEPILERIGVPAAIAGAVLPISVLRALMDALAAAADDPLFGIHLAEAARAGDYGLYPLLEYLGKTAPTQRRYLECVARYNALGNEVLSFEIVEPAPRDGEASFSMSIRGEPLCLGRQMNECVELMFLDRLRAHAGGSISVSGVRLAHEAHAQVGAVARAMGVERLEMGCGANAIILPAFELDRRLPGHDPRLFQLLVDHAELLLSRGTARSRFLGAVRQSIWDTMPDQLPTLESTARAIHTSTRSLQRRLGSERATFQDLLDSVREELARSLLLDPRRTVGEVADALHYSDSSTFVRAFKRWSGMAPSEFRAGRAREDFLVGQ